MKTPVEIVLPELTMPFELRKYQIEDVNQHAVTDSCGLFLGLGLGKTVVSIFIGCYKLIKEGFDCCIVLCPESLITQWIDTLEEFGLEDSIAYRATPAKRKAMSLDKDFIVMSYQIFQKDYNRLKDLNGYFIIDEGTVMCNTQNLMYKMINGGEITKKKKVPGKIIPKIITTTYEKIHKGVAILTATPINNPVDAFGLIDLITPGVYRNKSQFDRVHVLEYDYFEQPKKYDELELLQENLLLQASLRHPSDHLDLPPITFKTIEYELAQEHQDLYDKLLEDKFLELEDGEFYDKLQATALYNAAQRIIMNPEEVGYKKDPVGLEIMDGLVASADQFLIFNNYRATNSKMMERYKIGGIFSRVASKQKSQYIKDFQAGIMKGLTAHWKSGGFGLNLQNCHYGLVGEVPVTAREFYQAAGRMHRSGQEHPVIIVVVAAKKTIQQSLIGRLIERDNIATQVAATERSLETDLFSDKVADKGKRTRDEIFKELRGEV